MVVNKLVLLLYSFLDSRPWRRTKVRSSGNSNVSGDDELCCVCLSGLKEGGDGVCMTLPCRHRFHEACIERWFVMCRKTCPVCRFCMAEEERSKKREELTEEMVIWFSSFHVAGF